MALAPGESAMIEDRRVFVFFTSPQSMGLWVVTLDA